MTRNEKFAAINRMMENAKGDDLERCISAFRGCSFEQMGEQYGQSGKTRQQILNGYILERNNWKELKDFLEALNDRA